MYPFTILSIVTSLFVATKLDRSTSGLRIALYAWTVELVLIALPLLVFKVEYSIRTDLFVAAALLLQTAGYLLIRLHGRPQNLTQPVARTERAWGKEIRISLVFAVLGIVGNLILLRSADVSINFVVLIQDLENIRNSTFEDLTGLQRTGLEVAGSYLASASALAIISGAYFFSVRKTIPDQFQRLVRTLLWLAAINFALATLVSLFVYGGRVALVVGVLLFVLAIVLRGGKLLKVSPMRLVVATAAIVTIFFFSTAWLAAREKVTDPATLLRGSQRAEYHPLVEPFVRDSESTGMFLLSVGYYSSPLPTLSYYLERDATPGPLWGQYSYPLLARMYHRVVGTINPPTWLDTRDDVFWPLESAGYPGNVWATWLRDLIVDFGYSGALLFVFCFGALLAFARNRFDQTGSAMWHNLEVIGVLTLVFAPFQNMLWYTQVADAFFFAIIALVLVRLTPDAESPRFLRQGFQPDNTLGDRE